MDLFAKVVALKQNLDKPLTIRCEIHNGFEEGEESEEDWGSATMQWLLDAKRFCPRLLPKMKGKEGDSFYETPMVFII